jgi:hypothetical protein
VKNTEEAMKVDTALLFSYATKMKGKPMNGVATLEVFSDYI